MCATRQDDTIYLIDSDTFKKIKAVCDKLHSGNDFARDAGHILWLALQDFESVAAKELKLSTKPVDA